MSLLSSKVQELLSNAKVEAGKIKLAVVADLHEFLQIEEHFKEFAMGYVENLKEFHFTGEVAMVENKLKSLLSITDSVKLALNPEKIVDEVKSEEKKVETEIVTETEKVVEVPKEIIKDIVFETDSVVGETSGLVRTTVTIEKDVESVIESPVKAVESAATKVESAIKTEVAKAKTDGENLEKKIETVVSDVKKDL